MMLQKTEQSSNEKLLSLEERPVIPKKPFFRNVKYDAPSQINQVRLRLWRISSCTVSSHWYNNETLETEALFMTPEEKKEFCIMQKSPTLQKSLKNVRKVKLNGDFPFHLFFSKSWKIQSLRLFFADPNFPLKHFLRKKVNPKLENLNLGHWQGVYNDGSSNNSMIEALRHFTNLKSCTLTFPSFNPSEKRVPITLQRMRRLQSLKLENNFIDILVNEDLRRLKKLERLTLPTISWGSYEDLLRRIGSIPNLKSLSVHFIGAIHVFDINFLSFLSGYSSLVSLTLFVERVKNYSLDILAQLQNLKELTFKEIGAKGENPIRFPRIEGLEKFDLYLRNSQVDVESVRELFQLNPGIKEVGADVSLEELLKLLPDNLSCQFESLKLNLPKATKIDAMTAHNFYQILLQMSKLKKIISKASNQELYQLKHHFKPLNQLPLEEIEICYYQDRKKGNTTENFRDSVPADAKLKRVTIDMRQIELDPDHFLEMIDTFSQLNHIEVIQCQTNFDGVSILDYQRIVEYTRSIQKTKKIKIIIFGYLKDTSVELNRHMNSKYSLWHIQYEDE